MLRKQVVKKKKKRGEELERPTRSFPRLVGGRQRHKWAMGNCSGCVPVSGSMVKELVYWLSLASHLVSLFVV